MLKNTDWAFKLNIVFTLCEPVFMQNNHSNKIKVFLVMIQSAAYPSVTCLDSSSPPGSHPSSISFVSILWPELTLAL